LPALGAVSFWQQLKSFVKRDNHFADYSVNEDNLNKKIGDLEKFKGDKKELEQKLGVIHTLEENRMAPVKTLDDLATLVPPQNIWLAKVTQTGNSLRIEGVGRDNIAVADFMKAIEKFEPIKSVDLVSSKKTEISGITLQLFIFSCVMKKGF